MIILCAHFHTLAHKLKLLCCIPWQSVSQIRIFLLIADLLSLGWVVDSLYADSPPSAYGGFMPVSFTAAGTCTLCSRFQMLWSHQVYILWTCEEVSQVPFKSFLWPGVFGFCSFTESFEFCQKAITS